MHTLAKLLHDPRPHERFTEFWLYPLAISRSGSDSMLALPAPFILGHESGSELIPAALSLEVVRRERHLARLELSVAVHLYRLSSPQPLCGYLSLFSTPLFLDCDGARLAGHPYRAALTLLDCGARLQLARRSGALLFSELHRPGANDEPQPALDSRRVGELLQHRTSRFTLSDGQVDHNIECFQYARNRLSTLIESATSDLAPLGAEELPRAGDYFASLLGGHWLNDSVAFHIDRGIERIVSKQESIDKRDCHWRRYPAESRTERVTRRLVQAWQRMPQRHAHGG